MKIEFIISFPSYPEWHISDKTSKSMQFKSSDIMRGKEILESVVVLYELNQSINYFRVTIPATNVFALYSNFFHLHILLSSVRGVFLR